MNENALGEEFFDPEWWIQRDDGTYSAKCLYDGTNGPLCPCNMFGICLTRLPEIPKHLCHKPDFNNWKCPCG